MLRNLVLAFRLATLHRGLALPKYAISDQSNQLMKMTKTSDMTLPYINHTKYAQSIKHNRTGTNHSTQNREKLMHFEQENGLKPHFGPFLALIGPFLAQIIFFSKIGLRHFYPLIEG